MTAEEFIIEKWNKCIWLVHEDHPENIVMIYDKNHQRKLKLNSLDNNTNIKLKKSNDSIWLFYQDYKSGNIDVNYNEIWSVLEKKYAMTYSNIRILIIDTILNNEKLNYNNDVSNNRLKYLNPVGGIRVNNNILLDHTKLSDLKPHTSMIDTKYFLKKH